MICEQGFSYTPSTSYGSLSDLSTSPTSSDSTLSQPSINFDDLSIIKKLNKAKFPVFLTYSPSACQYFAMKVFPFTNGKMSPYFANEARFAPLDHPNIITTAHFEAEREALVEDTYKKISYIIMELAPYGDFFDVVMSREIQFDEKLARTYFRQLIEGLEYLHINGVAHLDIKLENLLLGHHFTLKIADFDQAHIKGMEPIITKGTICYRAPELVRGDCMYPEAADIYSAAIILFLFKSGGLLPHSEHQTYKGIDLFSLMSEDNEMFWERHCLIQGKDPAFFDEDFRELFNGMVRLNPEERLTIEGIKGSKWYNKPIYSQKEVALYMCQYY